METTITSIITISVALFGSFIFYSLRDLKSDINKLREEIKDIQKEQINIGNRLTTIEVHISNLKENRNIPDGFSSRTLEMRMLAMGMKGRTEESESERKMVSNKNKNS